MKKFTTVLSYFLFFQIFPLIISAQDCNIASLMGDATDRVVFHGNIPEKEGMVDRARNLWDLQTYNNEIYLGYGNTTTNPGPLSLYSFNPDTKKYTFELTLPTEGIERLKLLNDKLFIPNSDPKPGNKHKYYFKDDGVWTLVSSLPDLAHIRDMEFFEGEYYLVGNTNCPGSKTAECAGLIRHANPTAAFENDMIVDELQLANPLNNSRWNWFFGVLKMNNKLIIPNAMMTESYNPNLVIPDAEFFVVENGAISWSAFMPQSTKLKHFQFYPVDTTVTQPDTFLTKISIRSFESVNFNDHLLYTTRSYSPFNWYYNDHYNNSKGMIFKNALLTEAKFVTFPDADAMGEDLFVFADEVYALANKNISSNSKKVYVYKSSDPSENPNDWEEVLHFNSSNIARSFEYLDGRIYFGLGQNLGDDLEKSGQLISIAVCDDPSCPPAGQSCDDQNPCTSNDVTDGYCGCSGVAMDDDGDGICNNLEDCPADIALGLSQQFDANYQSSNSISFNNQISLNTQVSFLSKNIHLDEGFEIILGSELFIDRGNCP